MPLVNSNMTNKKKHWHSVNIIDKLLLEIWFQHVIYNVELIKQLKSN